MGTDSTSMGMETRLGPWKVLEPLRATELGTLYRSEWPAEEEVSEERPVALLALAESLAAKRDYQQRFFQQVNLAGTLKHPHLARIFGANEQNGVTYAVLEHVPGSSLRVLLGDGLPPPQQAVGFIVQAAEAVYYAYEVSGLTHGRLSPDTIIIDDQGRVQVIELGLPLALPEGVSRINAVYLSPEQRAGGAPSHQSDIYSLGAVLFELLTGVPPLSPPPAPDGMQNDEFDPQLLRPLLNRELGQVVAQALAAKPAFRYQKASEFITRLAPFLPQLPGLDSGEVKSPLVLPEMAGAEGKVGAAPTPDNRVNPPVAPIPDTVVNPTVALTPDTWVNPTVEAQEVRLSQPTPPARSPSAEKTPELRLPPEPVERRRRALGLPAPNLPQLLLLLAVCVLVGIIFFAVFKLLGQPLHLALPQLASTPATTPSALPTATPGGQQTTAPTATSAAQQTTAPSATTTAAAQTTTPQPALDATARADAEAGAATNDSSTAKPSPTAAVATATVQANAQATADSGTTATAAAATAAATETVPVPTPVATAPTPPPAPVATPTALPTSTPVATAPTPPPAPAPTFAPTLIRSAAPTRIARIIPTAIPTVAPRPVPTVAPIHPPERPSPIPTPRH